MNRVVTLAMLIAVAAAAYIAYDYATRPGPAEQAGAALDEAIDKTKRIIDVVRD